MTYFATFLTSQTWKVAICVTYMVNDVSAPSGISSL